MKLSSLTALALSLILASAHAEARSLAEIRSSGTLRVQTNAEYEPFTFFKPGETKRVSGFEADLIEAIAKRLGLKVEWINAPFDDLLKDLNKGRSDLVIASHTITSTRLQQVNFSNPHYCTGAVILTRQGGPNGSRDLIGLRVGAEKGTVNEGFLRKIRGVKVSQFASTSASVEALKQSKIDATVIDLFVAMQAMKDNPKAGLQASDRLLWKEQLGIAFAKSASSDALRNAVNAELAKMLKDGSYKAISERYFGRDIRC